MAVLPRSSQDGRSPQLTRLVRDAGLLRHPASTELAGLRETALHRLMAEHQVADPFKFLIYAELAGAEIGPVQ